MALGFIVLHPFSGVIRAMPRFPEYPFTLGVASGDPLPDGIVLWTRLVSDPLNASAHPTDGISVKWELSEDEGFRKVVRSGTAIARPELAHSVHVDVRGLKPGREYWYRFKSGSEISPVGRTQTAPASNERVNELTFAFVSCQNYEHGYYTAYQHMAKEDLDLVIHLGDYIYEYAPHRYVARSGNVRQHRGGEAKTLAEYRDRYAQYRSDPDLQTAHARFPWLVVWDDHEVNNNYAGDHPETRESPESFLRRRAEAYQAYYEHMPLRLSSLPDGRHMQLHRRLAFGDLADFHMLDTRQYRSDQVRGENWMKRGRKSLDPDRTLLGREQERWLLKGLSRSGARWNILAQQVFFSQRVWRKGGRALLNMDAWDGYAAARDRLLEFFARGRVSNPVILTGDVHSNWACDLKSDFDNPRSSTVGAEFVGTSVSSGGDGNDTGKNARRILADNPHIHFFNNQRGYVRCHLTRDLWQTDYRVVPYVSRPGAPIHTQSSFVVENGNPGVQRAGGSARREVRIGKPALAPNRQTDLQL